jgi:hypothetical protein
MGQLFDKIKSLVAANRYVVGDHAVERLDERGILEWQVVEALEDGKLLAERSGDLPNPTVEVEETLPDGVDVMAVWAHLISADFAKLVTVHFLDK